MTQMFGIMNERMIFPNFRRKSYSNLTLAHDLDIIQWGNTVQYVINNIRQNASATEQYILVPGTSWAGLSDWVTESKIGIGNVTDPSGKMLLDVHKVINHLTSVYTCTQ
jgi:hypothetical protein